MKKLTLRMFLVASVLMMLGTGLAASAAVQSWVVWSGMGEASGYQEIKFQFDGVNLTLNHPSAVIEGANPPGSTWVYYKGECTLSSLAGWLRLGTWDGVQVVTDPYASFVFTDSWQGYVSWTPGTPSGHQTNLLLGYPNETLQYVFIYSVKANWSDPWEFGYAVVENAQHSFAATVPEPGSVLTILTGCGLAILRRKR